MNGQKLMKKILEENTSNIVVQINGKKEDYSSTNKHNSEEDLLK